MKSKFEKNKKRQNSNFCSFRRIIKSLRGRQNILAKTFSYSDLWQFNKWILIYLFLQKIDTFHCKTFADFFLFLKMNVKKLPWHWILYKLTLTTIYFQISKSVPCQSIFHLFVNLSTLDMSIFRSLKLVEKWLLRAVTKEEWNSTHCKNVRRRVNVSTGCFRKKKLDPPFC